MADPARKIDVVVDPSDNMPEVKGEEDEDINL